MTSPMVLNILRSVLDELDRRELIDVVPGISLDALVQDVASRLQGQRAFAQFSTWLSGALLMSPHVEELYATDQELVDILREVNP
ncbi:MAG: hypothetical protein AAFV53_17880 [Myxococcota bacterium]